MFIWDLTDTCNYYNGELVIEDSYSRHAWQPLYNGCLLKSGSNQINNTSDKTLAGHNFLVWNAFSGEDSVGVASYIASLVSWQSQNNLFALKSSQTTSALPSNEVGSFTDFMASIHHPLNIIKQFNHSTPLLTQMKLYIFWFLYHHLLWGLQHHSKPCTS